ncbi:hypothetical protein BKA62DRAFT_698605 [Auriculariales sp. MPI-PUGE-AT-0066]|nr:hypothetical protein BKA62DRAFT_698605 [Auriculariales sp. MPI-PUGE-AT-0066]
MLKLALTVLALLQLSAAQDCRTTYAGILSAKVGNTLKSFTLNSANQVAYLGNGNSPLVVQYQACASLQNGEPPSTYHNGRVYVPAKGKCLTVSNPNAAAPPYYTTLVTCGTTNASPGGFTMSEGNIYWVGRASSDGTILQGGCNLLGWAPTASHTPDHAHSGNQIALNCNKTTVITDYPFHLSLQAL